jgi:hypothetical protein
MLLGKNPNFTFSVHTYHNSFLVAGASWPVFRIAPLAATGFSDKQAA